jgi:hypothetical protein
VISKKKRRKVKVDLEAIRKLLQKFLSMSLVLLGLLVRLVTHVVLCIPELEDKLGKIINVNIRAGLIWNGICAKKK